MNGIDSVTNQLATIPAADKEAPKVNPEKAQAIAAKALETIQAQATQATKVTLSALEVCRKIGEAATKARTALGHGAFTPWLNECFSGDKPKSGTTFSVQWIRMCMRVHEVFVLIEKRKDREAIIEKFGRDIKSFARVLTLLNEGMDPMKFVAEKKAAKLKMGAGAGEGQSDNEVSAKVLQRKLDAAEKEIEALKAKLAKAEAKVTAQALEISTLKDAAKAAGKRKPAGDVVDAVVKPAKVVDPVQLGFDKAKAEREKKAAAEKQKADGEKALEAARAAARKPKAPKAPAAAAKPKKATKPAKVEKVKAEPVDLPPVDTSDVPADLLANAASTLDAGMGAQA
jgi:hypothetical protein